MRSIADTIARLSPKLPLAGGIAADRLEDFAGFGDDPGELRARRYVPDTLAADAALVVVLHGCTQTAAGYDHGSGWSTLADRHGFALLYPEQTRANNANLCFNWFQPGDITRGQGEVASIRAMIAAMVAEFGLDPARVFVTGLSAGGAMTAAMLATYPEVFAGGAIIAGLPYGTASSVPQALDRMRGHGLPSGTALAGAVQDASPHAGAWPRVSVWHGTADATVVPAAGEAVVAQWRAVHGVAATPAVEDRLDGHARRTWRDRDGRIVVESHVVAGMGHGTPLDPQGGIGAAGAHMLDVGLCSTRRIAESWGLVDTVAPSRRRPERLHPEPAPHPAATAASGPAKIIEDALRAAGLMRSG